MEWSRKLRCVERLWRIGKIRPVFATGDPENPFEHHYGTFGGREAIYNWIQSTMSQPVNRDMRFFPIEWYMIDERRGWIVAQVWNRMIDPGDGSLHQQYNITILHYAGKMKWCFEEDDYNPARFRTVVKGWIDRKKELEGAKA